MSNSSTPSSTPSSSSGSGSPETEYYLISTAIIAIFVWLVPHLGIEIAQYRLSLLNCPTWNQKPDKLQEGLKTVSKHATIAIAVGSLMIAVTATLVALATRNLDARMVTVVSGLSRFMASAVCFFVSFKIPKWLGVYHSVKIEFGEPVGRSTTVLGFNVRWSLLSHFFQVYIYLLPFYCGVHAATIPLSAVVGVLAGKLISMGVYAGRTRFRPRKGAIAFAFAAGLSLLSAAGMAHGAYFVQTVWKRAEPLISPVGLVLVVFFGWLVVAAAVHFALWKVSQREFALMEVRKSNRARAQPKYQSDLFNPDLPNKILNARTPANGHVKEKGDAGRDDAPHLDGIPENATDRESGRDGENGSVSAHDVVELAASSRSKAESIRSDGQPDAELESNHANVEESAKVSALADNESARFVDFASEDLVFEPEEDRAEGDDDDDDEPTYWDLLRAKLCGWCCGGKYKRNDYPVAPERSTAGKVYRVAHFTFNTIVGLGFLYLMIVNIGSSFQMSAVNSQLNATYTLLYPPTYNDGPVCAFNNQGPNSTITTFATPQEANDAGFRVVHCGACGACSTWQNLKANWVTRDRLASLSQACAKKLLFGGYDAAVQCHLDTIGFDLNCTKCWIADEMCARDHCVFIFLQASLINSVGNFAVGPGTITSATCDEAICGPTFVPCSGATRRRMNITSDIARPKYQQCRNVQVNWTEVFGP